jgi:hypothetical protein
MFQEDFAGGAKWLRVMDAILPEQGARRALGSHNVLLAAMGAGRL